MKFGNFFTLDPACAQLRQPALRICAFAGCGMRMSAPVTRLTSVIESYGKLIAACALRMDSSSGLDMEAECLPFLQIHVCGMTKHA